MAKFFNGPMDGEAINRKTNPQELYFQQPYNPKNVSLTPKTGRAIYKLMGKDYYFVGYVPEKK